MEYRETSSYQCILNDEIGSFLLFLFILNIQLRDLSFLFTPLSEVIPPHVSSGFPKQQRGDLIENYMTPQHKNRSHGGINEFEQPSHLVPSIVDISICLPIRNISKFATRVVWTFVCVCRNLVHAETRRRP
jgi:hypothetical protein